jgi:hypothetical protein
VAVELKAAVISVKSVHGCSILEEIKNETCTGGVKYLFSKWKNRQPA